MWGPPERQLTFSAAISLVPRGAPASAFLAAQRRCTSAPSVRSSSRVPSWEKRHGSGSEGTSQRSTWVAGVEPPIYLAAALSICAAVGGHRQRKVPIRFRPHKRQVLFRNCRVERQNARLLDPGELAALKSKDDGQQLDLNAAAKVFAWLNWAPKPGSPCFETLHRCFLGALPSSAVLRRTTPILQRLGFTGENTLYGQSICPDEINHEKGSLACLFQDMWGECFPMGGIGGAPFVGRTGFGAFAGHVPEGGNVLILFGPHIAVSETGELGKYRRRGQSQESAACGALLAAYESCCSKHPDRFGRLSRFWRKRACRAKVDPLDMQQDWIKDRITRALPDIQGSAEPLQSLIFEAYESVKEELLSIMDMDIGPGHLVLLGGIQINTPDPYQDQFLPLMFEARQSGSSPISLLPELQSRSPLPEGHLGVDVASASSVFSWMSSAPRKGSAAYSTLEQCFPGALPGEAVVRSTTTILRQLGLDDDNTIYGQSICPDEINNERGDLAVMMQDVWGECFPMGGIGGAPFVGKTGFSAFTQHIPDDGHVLVLFGPHIAISESGELGKCRRRGQARESAACGGLLAAYDACCSGDCGAALDPEDVQQSWLREQIGRKLHQIQGQDEPLQALVHEAYESVKEKLLTIIDMDSLGTGYIVLLGGIQINLPSPLEDHFLPLMFQAHSKCGEPIDLLPKLSLPGAARRGSREAPSAA